MAISLTEGALEVIMTGGEVKDPVMQILGSKKIQGNGTHDRYRLHISDGKFSHTFAMLATQLNQKLINGELCVFTIVKINHFLTSVLNNSGKGEKRVMIILDLTVLASGMELGMKIGNPQPWQEGGTAAAAPAPPPAAPLRSAPVTPRPTPSSSMNNSSTTQLTSHSFIPINGLSPYQNRWTIKVRVMSKSTIRTWSNSKGEGKLFSMDLCDDSGEIRATAFKDQCDKFYEMIEVDKVYYISRCTLKSANKQFTTLKNDYEMTFTNDTIVEECTDSVVPEIQYNFVSIADIANKSVEETIDVIGICKTVSDITELIARSTGKQLKKREATLMDQSGSAIVLTMWGEEAETFDGSQQPVILVRGARISEYNGGKTLSVQRSSLFRINPDVAEAHKLRGWYDNGGCKMDAVNMSARSGGGGGSSSEWITFSDAEERQLGSAEKGDYYNVLGVMNYISTENALYKACPQEQCNKKLIDQENGLYRCEKCNREYPNYKYRIIMSSQMDPLGADFSEPVANYISGAPKWQFTERVILHNSHYYTTVTNKNQVEQIFKRSNKSGLQYSAIKGYVSDHTGEQWVTVFNETAEAMIGRKAEEIGQALESDKKAYTSMFEDITFKTFLLKIRTKMENFSDEARLKSTIITAQPIDYKEANSRLIKEITTATGITIN